MAGLQKAIDVIAAAEIRDGLLYHEGRKLTSKASSTQSSATSSTTATAPRTRAAGPNLRIRTARRATSFAWSADRARHLPVRQAHALLGRHDPDGRARHPTSGSGPDVGGGARGPAGRPRRRQPGANGRDVHFACCEVFKQHGYGSLAKPYRDIQSDARFIHGTGHGLGLEIHEFPRISEADVVLEVGDVITVEPGLYDPRLGGIRIEDLVVVTETGCRNLTTLPKTFHLD